ncbi:hypothetical protein PC129_g14291 [Phytophthora cactorum]|nr:hypothetical protein GQ600_1787 [Phytophthora cactorum]KAG2775266.1 hypothetical protein Pcac1_g13918 [Phytophthora cactorum]KAG3214802.1 hypothetical protein PC129_g14291 [Phytophthora cactorum]RAW26245.1 hypothetical protein PC110_g17344 [Phytophthora cactorum]
MMNDTITRRSIATEQEYSMLERLLIQTADDISKCLKVLKKNLKKHDNRNLPGFHYRSTSKYCLKVDIRVVKDMVSELRYVAKRVCKSKTPSHSEVNAARISMNGTADALNDLKKAGRIYDQNRGLTSVELQGKMVEGGGIRKNAETVEALVKSTLCEHFSGFGALENQIAIVEKALLPW